MKKKDIKKPIVKQLSEHEKALEIIIRKLKLGNNIEDVIKNNPQVYINILVLGYIILDVWSKFQ